MTILHSESSTSRTGGPSFSLSNRLYRAAWGLTWTLLARWSPPQLRPWRRLLLRLFGARMGKGSDVRPSASVWSPRNLTMGDYATIGSGVHCYSMAQITIDEYAVISQRAHLCTGTHDLNNLEMQLQARPIQIGAHVWICAEAFVGPGVKVDEGAVLGARGVTFTDLEAWTVYVGNPAQRLRARANFTG